MNSIDHPTHYQGPFECEKLAEQYSFNVGNVIKYVWRHDGKNGVEDLHKALWYARRALNMSEPFAPYADDFDDDAATLIGVKDDSVESDAEHGFWRAMRKCASTPRDYSHRANVVNRLKELITSEGGDVTPVGGER